MGSVERKVELLEAFLSQSNKERAIYLFLVITSSFFRFHQNEMYILMKYIFYSSEISNPRKKCNFWCF